MTSRSKKVLISERTLTRALANELPTPLSYPQTNCIVNLDWVSILLRATVYLTNIRAQT